MSRVGRNIIYNFAGQGLLLLLGLVAVRFVFRQLGGDALGIIYAAATVSAVLSGVLELGVSATIVREVAAKVDSDLGYVRRLIRTASLFYWSAYLLVALPARGQRLVSDDPQRLQQRAQHRHRHRH